MAIDYEKAMAIGPRRFETSYSDRDTMLYALAIGMAADPLDERELPYVFEGAELQTVPTMATVIARGGTPEIGINRALMLHGEERLTLHRPLPPAADLVFTTSIADLIDKGEGKGALLVIRTEVELADGTNLCSFERLLFARGDGGFGGPAGERPLPHAIPGRAPDAKVKMATRPDQALLYRLTGDRNPLHADPALAARAGFRAPILHGLCSYALGCRAILSEVCAYDHRRIAEIDVRFSAPVYPGETLEVALWVDGETVAYTASVVERGVMVLNNGRCRVVAA